MFIPCPFPQPNPTQTIPTPKKQTQIIKLLPVPAVREGE